MKRLALILALSTLPALAQIAVVPEVSNYPFGALPGSTRQIVTNVINTWTGVVSTSGTAVTYVSGNNFISGTPWVGSIISINSVNYHVASVASGTSLTLTTSAGTQSSVAYSFTGQCIAGILSCTINYTVSATTGGASAQFTTVGITPVTAGSAANALPTITVNIGSTSGTCSLSGSIGSYVFASTATVTVLAQSVDDNTKTGIFHFNVCANQPGTLANGEHGIVVAPAYKQAFQGQRITLQSWITGLVDETGVWSLTGQPGGGDGVLDDTTYRDTGFVAHVTGRYTVIYTSNGNGGTATAIIYVSPNALPAYAATPNATQPQGATPTPR